MSTARVIIDGTICGSCSLHPDVWCDVLVTTFWKNLGYATRVSRDLGQVISMDPANFIVGSGAAREFGGLDCFTDHDS